jgi:sugar lactone lactonase YvrE
MWLLSVLCLSIAASKACATPSPGDILVATPGIGAFYDAVVTINAATGTQSLLSTDPLLYNLSDIAVSADRQIYGTCQLASGGGPGFIVKVDPSTGAATSVSSGGHLSAPTGLTIDSDGSLIVVDLGTSADTGVVLRINPSTGTQTVLAHGHGFVSPVGAAVAANGDIFVVDTGNYPSQPGGVFKIDHVTGSMSQVVSSNDLYAICAAPNGVIYVAGIDVVQTMDPNTGSLTEVTSQNLLRLIWAIDVEPDGNLVIVDIYAYDVVRINPATGSQTLVSKDGYLESPLGLAIWPQDAVKTKVQTWGAIKGKYR